MSILVEEIKVAYAKNGVSNKIMKVLNSKKASMYDDEGHGQYCLEDLIENFNEESQAYNDLSELISLGYSYIEV